LSNRTPAPRGTKLARRLALMLGFALVPFLIVLLGFAIYVYAGVLAGAAVPSGTIAGLGVKQAASIVRDDRGIPHIRAQNEHDLFFLEGYAQGTDRLFQLDLYRRLVAGRLSEVFGSSTLGTDVEARVFDIDAIANAQLAAMPAAERANVDAFADGVNVAIRTRPLPPEFRVLAYSPQPWTAKDSIEASFATVLALTDTWDTVAARADVIDEVGPGAKDAFFSITDPKYDAPTVGSVPAPVAPLPPLRVKYPDAPSLYVSALDSALDGRAGTGSNDIAAGANVTATHRALLESDPHLELRIPGVWWLVDLKCPTLHVAGVTLAGVPGVILGHNQHLAWGATNGDVASVRIYREAFQTPQSDLYRADGRWVRAGHRSETFGVRFAGPVTRDYLRTRHGFVFQDRGTRKLAAAWTADQDRRSAFDQFDAVNRAMNAAQGLRAFERYPGPAQNFVFADDAGNAAYTLAGEVPIDDAWGITAHDGPSSPIPPQNYVPYDTLPHLAPGRNVVAFTANNRIYGEGYPYRLTADFAPPYRAASIAHHLAKRPYDVASFSAIAADVFSLPEAELAFDAVQGFLRKNLQNDADIHDAIEQLRTFDGNFTGDSRGAVFVTVLRRAATERLVRMHMQPSVAVPYLAGDEGAAFVALLRAIRDRPKGWVPDDDYDELLVAAMRDGIAALRKHGAYEQTWSDFGARTAKHPLAGFGIGFWNGIPFPGLGGPYSPHVQAPANAQSYRAVWDVGNWKAGGIVIPQGESGEPGSPHYRDAAPIWLQGDLVPLPFDDSDVAKVAEETLTLSP
jgi:penicillin amidase